LRSFSLHRFEIIEPFVNVLSKILYCRIFFIQQTGQIIEKEFQIKGKNTSLAYHWWGVSRYLNYCNANKFAADMASVAAGYTGAGLVAGIWFPGVAVAGGIIASYAALMSARVSANNNGSGVYIGITYAGFFNVEPQ
jgi:hypothetical protein